MQRVCMGWQGLLLALFLVGLGLPAAHAKSGVETLVGRITGVPMGTWTTVSTGSTGPGSMMQVDLVHAKITEKGKARKRYDVVQGMKVRVKGKKRGTALAADTVEILERPSKQQAHAAHGK